MKIQHNYILSFLQKSSIHENHKHINLYIPEISCFVFKMTYFRYRTSTQILDKCTVCSVCYGKCPQCVFLYISEVLRGAESEEKTCRGSQASFSVRIAVQGQYKLLTVYGAVLFL